MPAPPLACPTPGWKRYVDETFAFIDPDKLEEINDILNSFDNNISFTHELEQNNQLPFLDALISNNNGDIQSTVYRKPTNTDVYINWNAHAPKIWKIGTIRTLVKRALTICLDKKSLDTELKYIKHALININNYPAKVINDIILDERKIYSNNKKQILEIPKENKTSVKLILPYGGHKGDNLMSKLKKNLKSKLPDNIIPEIIYKPSKLSSKFSNKDKTEINHRHNIVYYCKCGDVTCNETYIGETNRRLGERIIDHNSRDKYSHILNHTREAKHQHVWVDDFKILNGNYNNKTHRKISEAIYIKELKPTLNVQDSSYPLKLFN